MEILIFCLSVFGAIAIGATILIATANKLERYFNKLKTK